MKDFKKDREEFINDYFIGHVYSRFGVFGQYDSLLSLVEKYLGDWHCEYLETRDRKWIELSYYLKKVISDFLHIVDPTYGVYGDFSEE